MARVLKISIPAITIILLVFSTGWGKTIHIPGDSSTIQAGIDAAVDGDTVLVADGIYTGEGNRDIDFLGKGIVVISTNGPELTIIDCEGDSLNIHRGFYFHNDENPESILRGFTIKNGNAQPGSAIYCVESSPIIMNSIITNNQGSGCAIRCSRSSTRIDSCIITANGCVGIKCLKSNVVIANCVVSDNEGSGVYCSAHHLAYSYPVIANCTISGNKTSGIECRNYSHPTISDCIITGNHVSGVSCDDSSPKIRACAISGNNKDGIFAWDSSPRISKCTIVGMGRFGIYFFDRCFYATVDSCLVSENRGTAIYSHNSSPTISNCTISDNQNRGILCEGSSPTITNCIISGNTSKSGAGIQCAGSHPSIVNCSIIGNTALINGGGILCKAAYPTVTNCTIEGNTAEDGGGVYCFKFWYPPIFQNCIISRNNANKGGGLYFYEWSFPILTNCTITENTANSAGGGIYSNVLPFMPTVTNSILWGDLPNEIFLTSGNPEDIIVTYCSVQGGWPGEGNLDFNPHFRDPENDDFHLMATYCDDPYDSPCIDAGHPDSLDAVLDCWHGLGSERSDMGAYGGSNTGWPTAVEMDEDGPMSVPVNHILLQNYPNPFNSHTVLCYYLAHPSRVTLSIHNVTGQRVTALVRSFQEAGAHRITWDARDVSSGIYFAHLEANGSSRTIKMMLLK